MPLSVTINQVEILSNGRVGQLENFINKILPLTFTVSNDMTFEEVLRQVRLEMLAAHRNQEMPYEQMLATNTDFSTDRRFFNGHL
jgi:hypothetical protein